MILRGEATRRGRVSGGKLLTQPVTAGTHRDVRGTSVLETREESWSKDGAVQDLVGGFAPDTGRHRVADVFGDADPASEGFRGVRGK